MSRIVSRSVKEQNKYLFNYANKLEFLISQTHKERANQHFKFKKMVSHIVEGLTHKNIMTKEADRALRLVQVMTAEDTQRTTRIEQTLPDAHEGDFLREALISGSKPLNYLDQGYTFEPKNRTQSMSDTDEGRGTINAQAEDLGSIKWNIYDKRSSPSLISLFEGKNTQENGFTLGGQDEKFSEFIKAEWNQMEQVKQQAVKRKRKQKYKELNIKHSVSENI